MRLKEVLFSVAALLCASAAAQDPAGQDVVYLRNGSVIHGDVVEVTPQSVKVVNGFGDRMVFEMPDVERIVKEPRPAAALSPATAAEAPASDALGCPARGYRGFVDFNVMEGFLVNDGGYDGHYSHAGLLTTHGYQFNPRIFVGAGLGVLWQTDDNQGSDFDCLIPVYSAFRCDFVARKVSPFVDVRLGGFSNTANSEFRGFYMSLAVGVRVRRFNASLGYEYLNNFGELTDYDGDDDYYWETCDSPSLRTHSFVMRFGVDFGRRR
ncbi:MAG: hypothetical protein ACI35Q_01770 [Marinilabiliaceae bacterium]